MIFIFNIIFKIEQISNITFGEIHATPVASGMDPFGILPDGFQPLALHNTSWRKKTPVAEKYDRGIFLECCKSFRLAPRFFILSGSMLYYILALSLQGRWYQNVGIYIQMCTDWCHLLGRDGTGM